MSFWKSISRAIYREYDRRIKRASLITEYGASHHHDDHADAHAEDGHVAHDHEEADEEAEIVNVPRGTPVAPSAHAAEPAAEAPEAER
jgi:hypothetical protein